MPDKLKGLAGIETMTTVWTVTINTNHGHHVIKIHTDKPLIHKFKSALGRETYKNRIKILYETIVAPLNSCQHNFMHPYNENAEHICVTERDSVPLQ
jgi:hypothetical protein